MHPISVSVSLVLGYAKSASKKPGILLARSNASVFYTSAFMGSPMSLHQRSLVCTWISPCQNPSTPLSGWSALPRLFVSHRASRHYLPLGNSSLDFLSFCPAFVCRQRASCFSETSLHFFVRVIKLQIKNVIAIRVFVKARDEWKHHHWHHRCL